MFLHDLGQLRRRLQAGAGNRAFSRPAAFSAAVLGPRSVRSEVDRVAPSGSGRDAHAGTFPDEFGGRQNIRELDTLDQMRIVAAWLVGKRLKYRDLIAANGLPSGAHETAARNLSTTMAQGVSGFSEVPPLFQGRAC